MSIDPKSALTLLVTSQLSRNDAAVIEEDGNYYFRNAKVAANAYVMIKSAYRNQEIEFKEEKSKLTETSLGVKFEDFNLGFYRKVLEEYSFSLKARFAEVTDADRYIELVSLSIKHKLPIEKLQEGFKVATQMIDNKEIHRIKEKGKTLEEAEPDVISVKVKEF